jgi:hypothetical protein
MGLHREKQSFAAGGSSQKKPLPNGGASAKA